MIEKNVVNCIGCEACVSICPCQCISMVKDEYFVDYPVFNENNCIQCGICKEVCPKLKDIPQNYSFECYAAYRDNDEKRADSSSGGVASVLYESWISSGGLVVGVKWHSENIYEAEYIVTDNYSEIENFKGSKYVHARIGGCYIEIEKNLKQGNKVLFIGLPCQLAGLLGFLKYKKCSIENLYTVDLICHGTCPEDYLLQEIDYLIHKNNIKRKIKNISFRSNRPKRQFTFVISGDEKDIIKSWRVDFQPYFYGFLRGITLREKCYECSYATYERLGDITIGDFINLGKTNEFKKFKYGKENNSIILVNTEKGKELIKNIEKSDLLLYERSVDEGIKQGISLQRPFPRHKSRDTFLRNLNKYKNFPKAIRKTVWKEISYNRFLVRDVNFIFRKLNVPLQLKYK